MFARDITVSQHSAKSLNSFSHAESEAKGRVSSRTLFVLFGMRRVFRTSVSSHIKCRIETLELDPCVVGSELPVDFRSDLVSGRLPSGNFVA